MFDYLIIGGGVAGSSIAYYLREKNVAILELDFSGSKSAGAFLSPNIQKSNSYRDVINLAFEFALEFYKNFDSFYPSKLLLNGTPIEKAGIVLPNVCKDLKSNAKIFYEKFETLEHVDDFILINGKLKTKKVIFAMGAYESFSKYIKIRPIWGQRVDIKSDTKLNYSIINNEISISKTVNNRIILGATSERFILNKPIERILSLNLIELTKSVINLENIEIVEEFGGVRAGSIDYFPIVGRLIDVDLMLLKYPNLKNGFKPKELIYHSNIYILNGLSARGFLLAPLLAKYLFDLMEQNIEVPKMLNSDRFFYNWIRKKD